MIANDRPAPPQAHDPFLPGWMAACVLVVLSAGLTGCFKVSSDAGALRDSVAKSSGVRWDKQIEIGVGAITLNLARTGLAFVPLDPDARTALHAVRAADVGVYQRRGAHGPFNHTAVLLAADKAMAGRGWDRIVGVMNRNELVAIYVRKDVTSTQNVKVCFVTMNREEMVVASARSNLEPLMELAFNHAEWRQMGHHP
jgi:hypothetical protein